MVRIPIQKVLNHIHRARAQHLDILKTLAAQPSISAQDKGVRQCAQLLQGMMEEMGITARQYETPGYPVVFGEVLGEKKEAFTLLFYGHYDVQPPEPLADWLSPPFEPTIRDGRLYGRGVADNKGQLLCHLLAVSSYLQALGSLPIHVKFLFEGEEESGSPYFPAFVQEKRDLLKAHLVYTSDGPMDTSGSPLVAFGVRGILSLEIILQTALFDNHSGNKGGVIPNAAWELIHLLSTMKDESGRVTIKGFYEDVRPPTSCEEELIEALPFIPEQLARDFGLSTIDLEKKTYYRRLMLEPTLTINGLNSGYLGKGSKTIIPGRAVAKLDIRLVLDMDPFDILEKIKGHVHRYSRGAEVVYQGHMLPSRTPPDFSACQRIVDGVAKAYGKKPYVMPSFGGSLPDSVWTKDLKIPSVLVPYANADESNHSPNENMRLDCFYRGIQASAQIIYELRSQ